MKFSKDDIQLGIRMSRAMHKAFTEKVGNSDYETASTLLRVFINAYLEDRITIKPKDRSLYHE